MSKARLLVIIGSGEMAAPMSRVHRSVIRQLAGDGPPARLRAAIVDTPYGFQSNAEALSAAALDFFGRRLGLTADIASFRRADVDPMIAGTAAARVREADFVFSGPGSPSYALSQWSGTEFPDIFADKLAGGGALVFASAAALTLGRFTIPVYEIYKAGADPYWLPGLDLLSNVGLKVAVVPHYDNREGTDHDTRFCFLGEERLATLERQLPDDVAILGVDEHSALVVDLEHRRASVRGRGGVTVRRQGRSVVFKNGVDIGLDELRAAAHDGIRSHAPLLAAAESAGRLAYAEALARADVDALVRLILATDDRTAARSMIVQLGDVARKAINGQARLVEPLVEQLVEIRRMARTRGEWAMADQIRARLLELGVEVADSADGVTRYEVQRSRG